MSSPFDEQDDAATPLDAEEKEGMIPSYITTRGELNEAEQANILDAEESAFARKRDTLTERFLDDLHKRMQGRVWRWAGTHRRSGKSVGIDVSCASQPMPGKKQNACENGALSWCQCWLVYRSWLRVRTVFASHE